MCINSQSTSIKGHNSAANLLKSMHNNSKPLSCQYQCTHITWSNSIHFIINILSGKEILASIKDHNFVTTLQKMTGNNSNLVLSISMHIQNLVKICLFVLKILSGNKILTAIKGHNYVINLQKITGNNSKTDLDNINHIQKFDKFCPFVLHIYIYIYIV